MGLVDVVFSLEELAGGADIWDSFLLSSVPVSFNVISVTGGGGIILPERTFVPFAASAM